MGYISDAAVADQDIRVESMGKGRGSSGALISGSGEEL